MTIPALEVADVLRAYGPAYMGEFGDQLSSEQRRVLRDLVRCRTAELGGHVEECDRCGHRRIAYNSCRNRHCPKCQAAARARWLEERAAELLPVEYFHIVVTLPDEIGPLALQNPRVVYGTLFRAVPRRRCCRSRPTRPPTGPRSASGRYCTTGGRNSTSTHTSISSCRAAAWRPAGTAGPPVGRGSSYP